MSWSYPRRRCRQVVAELLVLVSGKQTATLIVTVTVKYQLLTVLLGLSGSLGESARSLPLFVAFFNIDSKMCVPHLDATLTLRWHPGSSPQSDGFTGLTFGTYVRMTWYIKQQLQNDGHRDLVYSW